MLLSSSSVSPLNTGGSGCGYNSTSLLNSLTGKYCSSSGSMGGCTGSKISTGGVTGVSPSSVVILSFNRAISSITAGSKLQIISSRKSTSDCKATISAAFSGSVGTGGGSGAGYVGITSSSG